MGYRVPLARVSFLNALLVTSSELLLVLWPLLSKSSIRTLFFLVDAILVPLALWRCWFIHFSRLGQVPRSLMGLMMSAVLALVTLWLGYRVYAGGRYDLLGFFFFACHSLVQLYIEAMFEFYGVSSVASRVERP